MRARRLMLTVSRRLLPDQLASSGCCLSRKLQQQRFLCKMDSSTQLAATQTRSHHDADADRGNGAEAQNGHVAAALQSASGVHSQHVAEGGQPEAGSSPEADQSKLGRRADHSRHISWDEAFLETPAGNGILDSGSVCSRVLPCITNLHTHWTGAVSWHMETSSCNRLRSCRVIQNEFVCLRMAVIAAFHRPRAEFAFNHLASAYKLFSGCMLNLQL